MNAPVLLPCDGCSTLVPVIGLHPTDFIDGATDVAVYCLSCAKRLRAARYGTKPRPKKGKR